nr:unnamed protein product [Callosobruchus analis]
MHSIKVDPCSQEDTRKPQKLKKRKALTETDKAILKALETTQPPPQKEFDEDELFFASLLPSVRRLNPDDKLQFRVERLSRARVTIECAFAILSNRWRVSTKSIETYTKHAKLIIKVQICYIVR